MNTSSYVVRTGKVEGMAIVPFRDDLIKQAKDQGRRVMNSQYPTVVEPYWLETPPMWWPSLAPLTKAERAQVIEDLNKEFDSKRTCGTSTPSTLL